jgi:hypothetical protein
MVATMRAMAKKILGRLGGGSSKDGTKRYVKGKPSKEAASTREAFFAYKKKHPRPETLTGVQRRMQSGGA